MLVKVAQNFGIGRLARTNIQKYGKNRGIPQFLLLWLYIAKPKA
jgi:hypothetical protein